MFSICFHILRSYNLFSHPFGKYLSKSFRRAGDSHVRVWMPLVTCVTGTSSSGIPGHRLPNIRLVTAPWSLLTPFLPEVIFIARTAMLKPYGLPGSCPRDRNSSRLMPMDSLKAVKYISMASCENTSIPAGTGVWIVKTSDEETISLASWKLMPYFTMFRLISSKHRKAEWPSLIW